MASLNYIDLTSTLRKHTVINTSNIASSQKKLMVKDVKGNFKGVARKSQIAYLLLLERNLTDHSIHPYTFTNLFHMTNYKVGNLQNLLL